MEEKHKMNKYDKRTDQMIESAENPGIKDICPVMGHHFLIIRDGVIVIPAQSINRASAIGYGLLGLCVLFIGLPVMFLVMCWIALAIGGMAGNNLIISAIALMIQLGIGKAILDAWSNKSTKSFLKKKYSNKTHDELLENGTFLPKERLGEIKVYGQGKNLRLSLPVINGHAKQMTTINKELSGSDQSNIDTMKNALKSQFNVAI